MSQVVIKVIENYTYQSNNALGQGVYGKVYLGTQKNTKEKVAIKRIQLSIFSKDKYLENSIRSEIKLLQKLNHPNIIKFIDVLNSKSNLYIVTEFCKDGDLKHLIKKKKKMSEQEAFEVVTQILSGFTQLVQQKIIHRDLKPANILINNGVFKIADFGFARYVDNFGTQMLKSLVGSPIYMAPQILQRQQYTTKCDIWSIGVIFYEMIVGRHPWTGRDQYDLLRSIQNISISSLIKRQSMSIKAAQFLKKCLALREQHRVSWQELFETFLNKNTISKSPEIRIQKKIESTSSSNKTNTHLISNITPIKASYSSNIIPTEVPSPTQIGRNRQLLVNGKQITSNNRELITNNRQIISNNRQILQVNRETVQPIKQIIQFSNKQSTTPIREIGGIREYTSLIRQKQIPNKPTTTISLIKQTQKLKEQLFPIIRQPLAIKIRQKQSTLNNPRQILPISSRQPVSNNRQTPLTINRQTLTNRQGTSTSNIRQLSSRDIQTQNNRRQFLTNRQPIIKQTSNRQTTISPTYSTLSPEGLKRSTQINLNKHHLLQQLLSISRPQFFDPYKCDKLLYLLAQLIRTRSVSTLGLINFVMKSNKGIQDIAASAVKQHKIYEQTQKTINQLCSQNVQRIKEQLDGGSGFRHEIINQQRIKKLQKITLQIAFDLLKILLGQLRRRNNQKLLQLLQILINLVSNQTNNTSNIDKLVDSKQKLMRLIEKGEQLCY